MCLEELICAKEKVKWRTGARVAASAGGGLSCDKCLSSVGREFHISKEELRKERSYKLIWEVRVGREKHRRSENRIFPASLMVVSLRR